MRKGDAGVMIKFDRKAVMAGQYYPKRDATDWLRLVLRRHGDEITYADFTNVGQCSVDTFQRWAAERGPLTDGEVKVQHAEIEKIAAICQAAGVDIPSSTKLRLVADNPNVHEQRAERRERARVEHEREMLEVATCELFANMLRIFASGGKEYELPGQIDELVKRYAAMVEADRYASPGDAMRNALLRFDERGHSAWDSHYDDDNYRGARESARYDIAAAAARWVASTLLSQRPQIRSAKDQLRQAAQQFVELDSSKGREEWARHEREWKEREVARARETEEIAAPLAAARRMADQIAAERAAQRPATVTPTETPAATPSRRRPSAKKIGIFDALDEQQGKADEE